MSAVSQSTTSHLLNRLRLRQVAMMLAIHERGTLRGAADSLGLTQSAVSQMLSDLEETLGEPLFERAGRGLQLNVAGQAVLNSFRALNNNIAALANELRELRLGSSGKLVIGCISTAIPDYLCSTLSALRRLYPLLSAEIVVDTSDRLVEMLRSGLLDIVIGRIPKPGKASAQEYVFHPIADEIISIVVAPTHPLLLQGKKKIGFESLMSYPWILQPRGSPSRELFEQELFINHTSLSVGLLETTSLVTVVNMLMFDNMIAAIPQSIAASYEKSGILRTLPYSFKHSLSQWGSLVCRDRTFTDAARQFLNILHGDSNYAGRDGRFIR